MSNELILITGASGCVGQYTANWLIKNSNADLLLLLRDASKLKAIDTKNPRVELIIGDLRNQDCYKNKLSSVTRVIHTATAWGDPKRAYEVNVLAVKNLIKELNPNTIKQIIYFSTASILNKNLKPLNEALDYGTEYIQSKAICLKELEVNPLAKKIIAVFPTLVFGGRVDGRSNFPTSYLTEGLKEAVKWLWLARWFKVFSKFHFIHAEDIAFICGHLATTNPNNPIIKSNNNSIKKLVLAQPHLSINTAIYTLLKWQNMFIPPGMPLWPWLIELLVKILPLEITDWDRFSIKQKHFIHDPITNPESFGGTSFTKTLQEVLFHSGLLKHKKTKGS